MSDALFDVDPADPVEKFSTDQRRALRQAEALRLGYHPLAVSNLLGGSRHILLHDQAAPADDPNAAGPRCGNCRFRRTLRHHDRAYAKCVFTGTRGADEVEQHGPPRVTRSAATDLRAWWPACRDWEPGDPQLPDAMRWIPDVKEIR